MTIGDLIKEYRTANGLSQKEFGDRCGHDGPWYKIHLFF